MSAMAGQAAQIDGARGMISMKPRKEGWHTKLRSENQGYGF